MNSLENYKTLLDEDDIRRAVARLSHEIIESNQGIDDLILIGIETRGHYICLLYTSPSPRDKRQSRMPSSA